MNPISAFFVRNILVVYFFYGLAFFAMGLALALASRRTSEFRFARAIIPLAWFGVLHGVHEWVEMYQKVLALTSAYAPGWIEELGRVLLLVASFLCLLAFGLILLSPRPLQRRALFRMLLIMAALWMMGLALAMALLRPDRTTALALADVLSRYSLAIPAALVGMWALMRQQRTFREAGMPQFGRDLVWVATALFLYGVIGQIFVRPTPLFPSTVLNSTAFLQWFGIPIQLFRGAMAVAMAFFLVRALNAFEVESARRLDAANAARAAAQESQLQAERTNRREVEQLNAELLFATRELALLLDLANLLASPHPLSERLDAVLARLVQTLSRCRGALVLMAAPTSNRLAASVVIGAGFDPAAQQAASDLGERCIRGGAAHCQFGDGRIAAFDVESPGGRQAIQLADSPAVLIALPLVAQERTTGSLVFARDDREGAAPVAAGELALMAGAARQIALSIEHARLSDEARAREQMLGALLHQAVDAQESERQRIARELHDATGQSLTAIGLGLRGVETQLAKESHPAVGQVRELGVFSSQALGELRTIIADLRPSHLDDLGLVAALRWYLQKFGGRRAIRTEFSATGEIRRLPPAYETVLFRITQEALTNVAKHAQASSVMVSLDMGPGGVRLIIADDGRGFAVESVLQKSDGVGGWGILGMRERATLIGGQVEIASQPGAGTRVIVSVPLVMEASVSDDGISKDTPVVG